MAEVVVDQSAATEDGWASLGHFSFDPSMHHDVSVFDNTMVPVEEDQHISLDALRVSGEVEEPEAGCGCRSSGSPKSAWALLLGALAFLRRRRRR